MKDAEVLILGGDGQVGRSCSMVFDQHKADGGINALALGRAQCDITAIDSVAAAFDRFAPRLVVNCAALTNVDGAQRDASMALRVNRDGAHIVALACANRDIPLIHISTDYVFGQSIGRAFVETDPIDPLNIYGQSKAQGEAAILAAHPRSVILRTSWVYGPFASNFFMTMMRLAQTRDSVVVVEDEMACPTLALDLAEAIFEVSKSLLAGQGQYGIFHCCGSEGVSRLGFAHEIMDARRLFGAKACQVMPTTQATFGAPARRPTDSRLNCAALSDVYNITIPGFRGRVSALVGAMIGDETRKNG